MRFNTAVSASLATLSLLTSSVVAVLPTPKCPSGTYTLIDASRRPTTRQCETLGSLAAPSPLGNPLPASNLEACVETCKATAGCVSFGYSANNASSCVLYNKRLIDMKYKERNTDKGTVFSNMLCYKCNPLACTNLEAVLNGGFEMADGDNATKAANWDTSDRGSNVNQLFHREPGHARDGDYSAYASFILQPGTSGIQQVLGCVNPGLEYVVTAYYSFVGTVNFFIGMDGFIVSTDENTDQNSDGFKKFEVTVTPAGPAPTLVLGTIAGMRTGQNVQVSIDTVSMRLNVPNL